MNTLYQVVEYRLPKTGDSIEIDQKTLDDIFNYLMGDEFADSQKSFYTEAVLQNVGLEQSELQARSGGWTFHVSRSIAQSAVSGVAIAMIIKTIAVPPLSLIIFPAILPYLFQVDKTELSMKEEEVLLQLYYRAGVKGRTADDLYESLPEEIQEQINRLDFLELLDSMTKTGHAKEVQRGVFELRHPDHPRFVLNFV